jgi:hypothetical protein
MIERPLKEIRSPATHDIWMIWQPANRWVDKYQLYGRLNESAAGDHGRESAKPEK